jgi:hypothetical protein
MLNLSRERRFKLGCKGGDKLKNGNDTKIIVFVPRKDCIDKEVETFVQAC